MADRYYRGGRGGYDNEGRSEYDRGRGGHPETEGGYNGGGRGEYTGGDQGGYRGGRSTNRGRGRTGYNDDRGGRGGYYDDGGVGDRGYNDGGRGYNDEGRSERGGYNDSYQGRVGGRDGGWGNDTRGGRNTTYRGRGRYHNDWGRGGRTTSKTWVREDTRGGQQQEEIKLAPDLQCLVALPAHTNKLTAIAIDPASQKLYTGSHDGTVKCWSTSTGECTSSVDIGGEVDSLLIAGGYLFVGMRKANEGIIKIWDMSTGASHQLPGHKGEVMTMVTASGALFSAGADNTIRVWSFNAQASIFMSQAIITKDDGGHDAPVHALQIGGNFMFSADRKGIIKVWDLGSGQVVQSLDSNGDNRTKEPIMQLLVWDSYVLSASFDGKVKVWQILDTPAPGAVLKTEPEFCFDKDGEGDQQQRRRGPRPGIITMQGTLDAQGAPVVMLVYSNEDAVRLYDLPTFQSRGFMTPAPETRCLGMMLTPEGKGQIIMSGDNKGKLHIFTWKPAAI